VDAVPPYGLVLTEVVDAVPPYTLVVKRRGSGGCSIQVV
jgi:hypothetical protein